MKIKNPITIVNMGGQYEPGGEATLTAYDTSTGVLTGTNLGSTQGTVYLLDRDTNSYVSQAVSSWSPTSITLTTPIDTSVIEGTTSIVAITNDGEWSTKVLIYGDIPVQGSAKLYLKDLDSGTISTMTLTSDYDVLNLVGPNQTARSWVKTINGVEITSDSIVGIQFGEDFSATYASQYFLNFCPALNQPIVFPSSLVTWGNYFFSNNVNFNQPIVISAAVTTENYPLTGLNTFNQPISFPSGSVFRIPPLTSAVKFNQPIDFSDVTFTFPGNIMAGCRSFNSSIIFPSNMTSMQNSVFSGCYNFNQPITLPSGLTSIGNYFMQECYNFNQPITIPSSVTSIGDNFLSGCRNFNNSITFSGTSLTSIGVYFFSNNVNFNQPITLPSGLTSIGASFMTQCSLFDSEIILPSTLTTIGASFLFSCTRFNQPITLPSGLTTIGANFMQNTHSFSQHLTIPSTVTSVGSAFMSVTPCLRELTVETTTSPTDVNSLSQYQTTDISYVKGVTLYGVGASTWKTNLPDRSNNYSCRKLIDGTV